MISNANSSLPYFNDQQDLAREDPAAVQTRAANFIPTNDGSSQANAEVRTKITQSKKPTPSTISLLQQKFGISKEISFIPLRNGKLFFESPNGHFYPMPLFNVKRYQRKVSSSLVFTAEGLTNVRDRYDQIHGATTFLHAFLKMEKFSEKLHDMVKSPALYRYFDEEKFLLMSNPSYDSAGDRYISPKSLKLKDQGITLCAWFIHSNLSSINDDARRLLRELSEESASPKPLIEKLCAECASAAVDTSKEAARDEKTIGQLKQDGEYLATVLDLNASHIPMLKSLKKKTIQHLAEIYGVNKDDKVDLYFHFPYSEDSVTLHLHARVNHGWHPFEEGKSLTLDHIVSGLSEGKTIDEMILKKQEENNGMFYKSIHENEKIYENIEGVTIREFNPNIYRLDSEKSRVTATHSRDDLFYLKKVTRLK